jgi:NAD(P)-dependent dehydrogenase (short-subunit alcohol dehydrogenase family)
MHPCLQPGSVAVITGAASGIGLAAALHLARLGLRLCLVDLGTERLGTAREQALAAGAPEVLTVVCDMGDAAQIRALAAQVYTRFGVVNLLLNNAGIQPGSDIFDTEGQWQRILAVNMMGVVHCAQIFAPRMIAGGAAGLIVNTGSKQGITTPPGDPAYNLSKAGVKVFTEALQHHLRNLPQGKVEARLFIPGFVFTPLAAGGRAQKPDGAWTPAEVVDFLMQSLERDDFYILCPDNDVSRATDEKRIAWAAGDIIANRPPLSRWHPDHAAAFQDWLKS